MTSEREARERLASLLDDLAISGECSTLANEEVEMLREHARLLRTSAALTREQREGVTDEMVSRFLGWKLPADFAPDCGITFDPIGNKGTRFEYRHEPVGTNLLTAIQARAMLEYVLAAGAPTAQQPLDGTANNPGVATGSRNASTSESVTRGNLPPSIPQPEAPGAVAWLVVSERAGVVSAETNEVAADNTIRGVQKEYGDAYGRTYKRPLIFGDTTPPAPVPAGNDGAVAWRFKWNRDESGWQYTPYEPGDFAMERGIKEPLFTHPAPSDAVVEALRKLVAAAAWSATTNTPFAHNSAAVAEAKAALATRCPVVVDEDAREAIDAILSRLEGWAKAYPVDIFHEPTQEERDWLHATKPGLMDCISASMGRHMAKCVAEDLAALRAALEVPNG